LKIDTTLTRVPGNFCLCFFSYEPIQDKQTVRHTDGWTDGQARRLTHYACDNTRVSCYFSTLTMCLWSTETYHFIFMTTVANVG